MVISFEQVTTGSPGSSPGVTVSCAACHASMLDKEYLWGRWQSEVCIQSHFKCEESELGTGIGNRLQASNTLHVPMHTQSHQRGAVTHRSSLKHKHLSRPRYSPHTPDGQRVVPTSRDPNGAKIHRTTHVHPSSAAPREHTGD